MLDNFSSYNESLLSNLSSINHHLTSYMSCFLCSPGSFIFTSYIITNIFLLLPLCIFILYHGLQQQRQKRSTSTAAAMSHCDCFTYHMVTIELIGSSGCIVCSCAIISTRTDILSVGFSILSFTGFGKMFFHILTCLERYLAVVHPIIYLSLKQERGIRIRNISTGCVWLLCSVLTSLQTTKELFIIVNFCLLILSLIVISFFSIFVLYVLISPGPGEQNRGRQKAEQPKKRAFYTIVTILGALVLNFTCGLVWAVLFASGESINCVIMTCELWFHLPSSLVLPLLFLHREGKLGTSQ